MFHTHLKIVFKLFILFLTHFFFNVKLNTIMKRVQNIKLT